MTEVPLHSASPDALLARLAASGLRGRGGGWFEAARKWRAVRAEGGEPAAAAVATAMARGFERAVDAHLSGGSCPWPGRRHPDPFAPASPERAAVEAAVQEQLR